MGALRTIHVLLTVPLLLTVRALPLADELQRVILIKQLIKVILSLEIFHYFYIYYSSTCCVLPCTKAHFRYFS